MIVFFAYVLYPNISARSLKLSISILAICTFITFILSWLITPGYLQKKAEGEFLLLLTKFDPNTLCPFCEVVQIPLSKHCFACNKCIQEFDHHCYWINNCVGRRNHLVFLMFIISFGGFLSSMLLACLLSKI